MPLYKRIFPVWHGNWFNPLAAEDRLGSAIRLDQGPGEGDQSRVEEQDETMEM